MSNDEKAVECAAVGEEPKEEMGCQIFDGAVSLGVSLTPMELLSPFVTYLTLKLSAIALRP